MRKDDDDSEWEPLQEKDMAVVEDFGSTYLRAQVHHFTCFCKWWKIKNPAEQITFYDHNDKRAFQLKNATDATLLVVTLETEFVKVGEQQEGWGASAGGGGVQMGINRDRRNRKEAERVSTRLQPDHTMIGAKGVGQKAQKVDLLMNAQDCAERLIICSIENVGFSASGTRSSSGPASPAGATAAPASTVTPASGTPQTRIDCGEGPTQLLRLYNVMKIFGGKGIVIHQARLNVGSTRSREVNRGENVVDIAMSLAGIPAEESASKMRIFKFLR